MLVGCLSRKGSCNLAQGPEMSMEMAWTTAVAECFGAALNQIVFSWTSRCMLQTWKCCFMLTYVGIVCHGLKFFQEIERAVKW